MQLKRRVPHEVECSVGIWTESGCILLTTSHRRIEKKQDASEMTVFHWAIVTLTFPKNVGVSQK